MPKWAADTVGERNKEMCTECEKGKDTYGCLLFVPEPFQDACDSVLRQAGKAKVCCLCIYTVICTPHHASQPPQQQPSTIKQLAFLSFRVESIYHPHCVSVTNVCAIKVVGFVNSGMHHSVFLSLSFFLLPPRQLFVTNASTPNRRLKLVYDS